MDNATASSRPSVAACSSCARVNELAAAFDRMQGEMVRLRRTTDATRVMTDGLKVTMDRMTATTTETSRVVKEMQTTVARLCARTVTP